MTGTDLAIELRDVHYRYSANSPDVLAGIDLQVPVGAIAGLVGESGSGKSTLGRLVVHERSVTSGTLHIEGADWTRRSRRDGMRGAVQMIFQDPFGSLNPYLSPESAVAEAARIAGRVPRADARDRARSLLESVGLRGRTVERLPASLSGGQRQRVAIARALACNPRILVADEATSALDVSVQAQILNLLMTLQRDLGLTILFISHDMAVINHITDQVAVLQGGRVVESGPTDVVLSAPQHEYTRTLLSSFGGGLTEKRGP